MSENHNVLLTGATAQVGLHLLPLLPAAGFRVLALSRQVPATEEPAVVEAGRMVWFHPGRYHLALKSPAVNDPARVPRPEVLVSTGPIALAAEWLRHCPTIRRVVCLSTTSIFSKMDSGNALERKQIAAIIEAEQQLAELCSARGAGLCLFRPTLIYGCGMDENVSRMAAFIGKFGFLPLAGRASGLRQPIHVADLAGLILTACTRDFSGQHAFTVTGGSTLAYRDMAVKVFATMGKPLRLASLPPAVLSAAVVVASKLGLARGLNPAMVKRQNSDLVFDDHETRRIFGFQPRCFDPGPEDFELPDQIRCCLPPGVRL